MINPVRQGLDSLKNKFQSLTFSNPLYQMTLQGGEHQELLLAPQESWPGDAAKGLALQNGIFEFCGHSYQSDIPNWAPVNAPRKWINALHNFEWLRDLRAAGGDNARRLARSMVSNWLDRYSNWEENAWAASVTGRRVAAWIGYHDFFCASADDAFRARVYSSIAKQSQHLARVLPAGLHGAEFIAALRGLAISGLCLDGGEPRLQQALYMLDAELQAQVFPDGGHIERSPAIILEMLRHLIDVRNALRMARAPIPDSVHHAIDRLTPALRFFRHGDGGLTLFNDTNESNSILIEAVLNQADARGRPLKSAPHIGFERLSLGRTLVLMDSGVPAPRGFDKHTHAGTLSFEMSVGRERLIVNCGCYPGDHSWRPVLRATAAHSTITINDTNSSEIVLNNGLGRRPTRVTTTREDMKDAILVDAEQDGYLANFGVTHRRRLYLTDHGDDFRGEDILAGGSDHYFVARFHLHPQVHVSITQNAQGALLKLPSGAGWRFRIAEGHVALEESIYFGHTDLQPRKTQQIVVTGKLNPPETILKWSLRREKRD